MSPIFNVNVGVGQGSALSLILSALYLLPFIYILENYIKNLKIPVSIISFIDDGLLISQSNSFDISNSHLYCSYNVLTNLLEKFGLVVKHSKTEIFHFNRSHVSRSLTVDFVYFYFFLFHFIFLCLLISNFYF